MFKPVDKYEHITVAPVTAHIGAEIGGIEVGILDKSILSEIHMALMRYQVIFFRDQEIEPPQFAAFARQFGYPQSHKAAFELLEGAPEVAVLANDENVRPTSVTDGIFEMNLNLPQSCMRGGSNYGGDTIFVSMTAAYSFERRNEDYIENKGTTQDFMKLHGSPQKNGWKGDNAKDGGNGQGSPPVSHPMVELIR